MSGAIGQAKALVRAEARHYPNASVSCRDVSSVRRTVGTGVRGRIPMITVAELARKYGTSPAFVMRALAAVGFHTATADTPVPTAACGRFDDK